MKNFFNSAQYISKYSILVFAAVITVFATAAVMAADVTLDSDIGVKNITDNATTYTEATNADKDDVVRFRVWYTNAELSASGKVAENVTVTVDFPSNLGKTHVVTSTVNGDNTNTVTDTATVNAPSDTSSLVYIPGSAKWQHNVGTREDLNYIFTDLNDNVITEGKPIVIGDVEPSNEFEGWVYFDAVIRESKKPETPVYTCESLTTVVNPTNRFAFTFTTKTETSGGASVNKYIYNFGVTGESPVSTDKAQISKIYKEPGTYNVSVEVIFNVGEVQKSDVCKTTVPIKPEQPPVEPPVNPPAPELPKTGPAETALAGLFGAGALSYGAMSLRARRSGLREKMLGKK